jgi:hypothetical protein
MTTLMTAIGIAVCGTFLVYLLLFKQAQKRSGSRRCLPGIPDSMAVISASATPADTIPMARVATIPDLATPPIPAVPVTPVEAVTVEGVVTAGAVVISDVPRQA